MNKSDLVDALAAATDMSKADAGQAIDALFGSGGVIAGALKSGDKVQVTGFGTFEARDRSARTARNPQTGEEVQVAATRVPAFKAGKAFKDQVKP